MNNDHIKKELIKHSAMLDHPNVRVIDIDDAIAIVDEVGKEACCKCKKVSIPCSIAQEAYHEHDDAIVDEKNVYAFSEASAVHQKMPHTSRYLIEVDLPVHHFKPIADRKIEAVTLGKEEE